MGISIDEVKEYLRVSHNLDDDFISELIEAEKMYIKNNTGVAYNVNDYQYNQLIKMMVHQHYFNRGGISETVQTEIPYAINNLLEHIKVRGALNA